MAAVESPIHFWEEIADLVASRPSLQQLLEYRPSDGIQRRALQLISKLKSAGLSAEEQRELDQYEQGELFIRLVKAQARHRN